MRAHSLATTQPRSRPSGGESGQPAKTVLPKRVLVLAGYAQSLLSFRSDLLDAIRARGHTVVAAAPEADSEVAATLRCRGIEYVPVPLDRAGINPAADLRTLGALVGLTRRFRPDTLLAYTAKPVIWGHLAARIVGVPHRFALITGLGYAFIEDGSLRRRVIRRATAALYRHALVAAEGVIFFNDDDRDAFRAQRMVGPGHRLERIDGSGVDTRRFAQVPPPPGPPTFLLVARLLADKGIREFVEAARIVRAQYPGARFHLLGPPDPNPAGIGSAEVEAWVAEGAIEYLGQTPDVRPQLAASSVFVLPSYREGVPRSVLEAMATGRAIVTTDAPGCRSTVVPNGNGLLVPVRDAVALARAMARLAADPALVRRMGECSRAIAEVRFDVRAINARMLKVMDLG